MKTINFHIVLLLSCMIWDVGLAQNYINYTEKDGLASNYVYRARQDHDGFIWFLTDKGMSKFDGKTFKNFTVKDGLPANDIWNMRITPDNRVWFFTRSDNLGYIQNDSVYSFKSDNNEMMNPNGPIFQSGNDLSFVKGLNIWRFSDSSWQIIKNQNDRFQLLNRDLFIVRDSTFRHSHLENNQGQLLLKLERYPISRKPFQFNDSLLVAAQENSYEIINLNSLKVIYGDISHLEKNELPNNLSWFILANDKLQLSGNKWLITFDENLDIKETYTIPGSLNSTHNFRDKHGFIWAATSEKGAFKLPIKFNNIISFFEGKLIQKIEVIDDVIYVAVGGEGIFKVQHNKPTLVLEQKSRLYSLERFDNNTYYNFRFHLIIEKDGNFKKIEHPDQFSNTFLHYRGNFFTEGFSAIGRYNNNFEFEKFYIDYPYFQGIFSQNDTLFSFSYKTMLYLDSQQDSFTKYKNYQIQKKLLTSENFNDQTYIGTEGDGLYTFEQGKLNKLIDADTAIINHISLESENSIWVVSEGALMHYYRDDTKDFSVKKYNQINGFPTDNLTGVLFHNNQLYLGSTTGLTIIDKEDINGKSNFTPYVKSVFVNGKKKPKDSVVFDYYKNSSLKVNFGSINFFDSNNTSFQYQLLPDQTSWTTTESGEVNLYDLQPEEYILQLKVIHNDHQQLLSVPITIVPRWYQTDLALTVYSLALVAFLALILFLVVRYFENKLSRVNRLAQLELKALRSQMNPHFVHNSLNAIQYYIQRHEVELSENYLAKFSKLIRLFFDYSRRRTITLKEEMALLEEYLQIEKMRFEDKLDYNIQIDGSLDPDEQLIPSMILQPIVENAVNHGVFHKNDTGKVEIAFRQINDSTFEVTVEDDGIGINKAKELYKSSSRKYQSHSSAVLSERIALLNESKNWNITYSIADRSTWTDTHGTIVRLTFNQMENS